MEEKEKEGGWDRLLTMEELGLAFKRFSSPGYSKFIGTAEVPMPGQPGGHGRRVYELAVTGETAKAYVDGEIKFSIVAGARNVAFTAGMGALRQFIRRQRRKQIREFERAKQEGGAAE